MAAVGVVEGALAAMNREVVVTCAVTGSGDSVGKHPAIPVTPEQIAVAAIEAAKAGAAVAHVHVRDPATGKAARRLELYREVVQRVRESGVDVILNLTAGMGGDFVPDENEPWRGASIRPASTSILACQTWPSSNTSISGFTPTALILAAIARSMSGVLT